MKNHLAETDFSICGKRFSNLRRIIFVGIDEKNPYFCNHETNKRKKNMQNTTMTKHPRVDVADVLRGIAVMGIILLHSIEHFNFYSYPDTAGQSEWLDFSDKAIWDGMFFLFGGKAYAVFALLFGFSFFIQYDNQRLRGKDFRGRFCWRLFLLFLFGNLNASFFTAEVLVLYSLVGFILPLTCRLKDKWLLVLACVLLIQPLPLYYAIRAACDPAFVTPAVPTGHLWAQTFAVQQLSLIHI